MKAVKRCMFSLGGKAPSEKALRYHDTRRCKPEHRDGELFAMLVLEGMQAEFGGFDAFIRSFTDGKTVAP